MARWLRKLAVLATAVIFASPLHASEITVVSSAFEEDTPFELKIQLGWVHSWHSARITREHNQTDPETGNLGIVNAAELQYSRTINQIRPTIRAGLYKDLEIFITWPYVFREAQDWDRGTLAGRVQHSTLHNTEGLCASGMVHQDCAEPLLAFTDAMGGNSSYRGGLDNGTLGFRWGVLNEDRHPWSANWVIGASWTFPMQAERAPNVVSHATADPAPVSDRVNRWNFETALSRTAGPLVPFVRFHYTLPRPQLNAFHNCDQASSLADMDLNTSSVDNTCMGLEWTRQGSNLGGMSPAHMGGIEFGTEVVPYVIPEEYVRVAVQLSAGATYVSEGRDFTILSDALQRLTYHDEYAHLYTTIGLRAQPSRYGKLHTLFTFGYDTPHLLTRETIGRDRYYETGEGEPDVITLSYSREDIELDERNPNYDFRWDQVGRRFGAENSMHYTLMIVGEMTF